MCKTVLYTNLYAVLIFVNLFSTVVNIIAGLKYSKLDEDLFDYIVYRFLWLLAMPYQSYIYLQWIQDQGVEINPHALPRRSFPGRNIYIYINLPHRIHPHVLKIGYDILRSLYCFVSCLVSK